MMRRLWAILAIAAIAAPAGALDSDPGYRWQAELDGPVRRCGVPKRILFVMADAIVGGKIRFEGVTYIPRGRIETTLETKIALVRFHGDPKPLVSIAGRADGTWTGSWTSPRSNCTGRARISVRP
jgi:hypothetical protein